MHRIGLSSFNTPQEKTPLPHQTPNASLEECPPDKICQVNKALHSMTDRQNDDSIVPGNLTEGTNEADSMLREALPCEKPMEVQEDSTDTGMDFSVVPQRLDETNSSAGFKAVLCDDNEEIPESDRNGKCEEQGGGFLFHMCQEVKLGEGTVYVCMKFTGNF